MLILLLLLRCPCFPLLFLCFLVACCLSLSRSLYLPLLSLSLSLSLFLPPPSALSHLLLPLPLSRSLSSLLPFLSSVCFAFHFPFPSCYPSFYFFLLLPLPFFLRFSLTCLCPAVLPFARCSSCLLFFLSSLVSFLSPSRICSFHAKKHSRERSPAAPRPGEGGRSPAAPRPGRGGWAPFLAARTPGPRAVG